MWWDLDFVEVLGEEDVKIYCKVLDMLDVWFDLGLIYVFVVEVCLEFNGNSVDMYFEGLD